MIFERVRNYILFRINCTSVILFWSFLAGLVLNFGFPALVLMIIAFFNNFIVLAIAYDHIEPQKEPIVWTYRDLLPMALTVSLLSCCEVYCAFSLASGGYLAFSLYLTPAQVRTAVFLTLSVSDQLTILSLRARSFITSSTRPSLGLLLAVIGTAVAATICSIFWPFGASLEPLGLADVGMCWVILVVFFFIKVPARMTLCVALTAHCRTPPRC